MKEVANMGNWWKQETPETVTTGANVFQYFPIAGRLKVSMPFYEDEHGIARPGKTVTIKVAALRQNREAMELFRKVLNDGK